MTPRGFDRYMVAIGMGTHPKLAGLTDSEFRAHVVGVLAVAAMSPVRGRLLVGSTPAEPLHIAAVAKVPEKVAATAMRKLMAVGVLRPDDEHACLRVHDWDDINPSPGAARTKRWRDGKASPERHGNVTERHGNVTRTSPEVKKVEEEEPASQVNTSGEIFDLCSRLGAHVRRNDPKADPKVESTAWLTDMRLLVADRGGDIAEVERVIDWCQADSFWRSNILSPGKLRKQFTQLTLRSTAPLRVVRGRDTSAVPKSLDEMDARTRERIERLQAGLGAEEFQASKEQR